MVYETSFVPMPGRFEGREAVIVYLKATLDRFDRRFAERELRVVDGPREEGDSVWVKGSARYRAPGAPDLEFVVEEIATFAGDRISHLEDRYDDETRARMIAYLEAHGATVGIPEV